MRAFTLILLLLLCQASLFCQTADKIIPIPKTDYWGDIDGYLNQQDKETFLLVNEALKINPPAVKIGLTRKMALLMIDNVLHEEKAGLRPAVQEFLLSRIKGAVEGIKATKVTKGAMIWKLYNHSYVIKTPSVTIGFDIQRGWKTEFGPILGKDVMKPLIDVVDILFISHYHNDHTDEWVAQTFLDQGKPIVAPPGLWIDKPFYNQLVHPERIAFKMEEVRLSLKGLALKYISFPGHQGESILNNVNLVFTPEGISIAQTGDQSNEKDFEWIDKVGDKYKVDVLMTNSWAVYPDLRLYRGFRPKLIIPGHENEMGHTIDHREPYWLNPVRLGDGKVFPWVQLVWGEKYEYLPGRLK